MKKILLMLALATSACGNSSYLKEVQPNLSRSTIEMQEIKYDRFSYLVPNNFKTIEAKNGTIYQADPNNTITVIMEKEKFDDSLGVYMWARADKIIHSNDNSELLGNKFIKIDHKEMVVMVSKNDKIFLIQLLMINKKQAYTLNCAGALVFGQATIPVCTKILTSLKYDK